MSDEKKYELENKIIEEYCRNNVTDKDIIIKNVLSKYFGVDLNLYSQKDLQILMKRCQIIITNKNTKNEKETLYVDGKPLITFFRPLIYKDGDNIKIEYRYIEHI